MPCNPVTLCGDLRTDPEDPKDWDWDFCFNKIAFTDFRKIDLVLV